MADNSHTPRGGDRVLALALCLLLAGGCATTLAGRYDFDAGADFSGYRTWYWMTGERVLEHASTNPEISPLLLKRIGDTIESQLEQKGFARAEKRSAADFVVTYTVGSRQEVYVENYPWRYRGPWYWSPYMWWDTDYMLRTYTVGILAIDIFDQETHAPVWHGWTTKRVSSRDLEQPDASIIAAVSAILANFPPQPKTESARSP